MADEIGAKIVITGEDRNASSTVKSVATAASQLVEKATEGDRALAKLDSQLQGLSAAKITEVERGLEGMIAAESAAGRNTALLTQQLERVRAAGTNAAKAEGLLNEKLEGASPERLKQVEFELQRVIASGNQAGGMMVALREKLGAVQVLNAGHAGGLDGMAEKLSALTSQVPGLQSIGNVFGAVLNPEVAAFTALMGTAAEAITAFARKQDAITGLDAALAQNGDLVEGYRQKLQSLASQYGKLVGGAGAWIEVEKHLTQVGADPSHIQEYLEAVKNLAAFLGGDVQQASNLFGRALAGHTEMLSRYGIEVDKSASKTQQIKQIMDELAQRGGGQFEARVGTISKEMENLSKSTGGFSLASVINIEDRRGPERSGTPDVDTRQVGGCVPQNGPADGEPDEQGSRSGARAETCKRSGQSCLG